MINIKHSTKPNSLFTLAGLIGPILFVGTFLIYGALRPGYNALSMYVSALSLGPYGWIQIANFIIFGSLLFLFSRGVTAEFQKEKASLTGPYLLYVTAICFLLSGPFTMDQTAGAPTFHGILHGIFGAIVFTLMPITCFVFWKFFRKNSHWQSFQTWTFITGLIIVTAVINLTIATKIPVAQNTFQNWLGLIQRAALIPYSIWLFAFALKLRQKNK